MLYSIIPPILVILSLVAIIIFLAKKAPQVAAIDDDNIPARSQRRIFGKKDVAVESAAGGIDIKHRALGLLDGIIGKLKRLFFGIGRLLTRWSESIKEKRRRKIEEAHTPSVDEEEKELEEKIATFERTALSEEKFERPAKENIIEEEKIQRPLVSEPVTMAVPKPEIKEHLEKILIDRIASNPKDIEAYERLGEYYMEIENWGYAKECFKQIVKLDPRNKNVRVRMRKLERLLSRPE